jgi:thiamine pyrophosphate-dependent acetolactate synthase large subunit-like protein
MNRPFDRQTALAALVPAPADYLIVAGLGNAVFDVARLTGNAPFCYPLDGAMGAAVSMGLGLALARPERRVLVVTGDGELLMNLGSLATVAAADPGNLSIVCLDNHRYGLTGGQPTHTAAGADIEKAGAAVGIRCTCRPEDETQLRTAATLLRTAACAMLVVADVDGANSAPYPVDRDGDGCRIRFRAHVMRTAGQET